tara:strand:+ start:629 stop:1585 length:957 start_codon:yes stop_codon:yes gene_type:complete
MALPLLAPLVGLGKGLLGGIVGLGKKAAVKTAVKSVTNRGEEQVKTKISPSRLSPRYYEKPKEAKKSTPKTSGGSVKSVKMTAENIKSSLLNQDKLLKTLKSNNAKFEKQELERQKQAQAVSGIKSGLKSIGSKLTSPIKGVTRGIGTAIPLLIAGILVNSLEGIISGIRNYYEKNLKPKVEFVQKKFDQLSNFLSNFSGDKERVTRNREKVDKQVENLKKVIDENEIEDGVKKLEGVLNKGKFNNLSEEEKDKFVLEKLQTINPEIQSLTKDNSDLISSLPFNTNINTDTSNMYDENLLNENSSEIVIVNRTLVVSE